MTKLNMMLLCLVSLVLLNGCAGREQAHRLVQEIKQANEEASAEIEKYYASHNDVAAAQVQINEALLAAYQRSAHLGKFSDQCERLKESAKLNVTDEFVRMLEEGDTLYNSQRGEAVDRLSQALADLETSLQEQQSAVINSPQNAQLKAGFYSTFINYTQIQRGFQKNGLDRLSEALDAFRASLKTKYTEALKLIDERANNACTLSQDADSQIADVLTAANTAFSGSIQSMKQNQSHQQLVQSKTLELMSANARAAAEIDSFNSFYSTGDESAIRALIRAIPQGLIEGVVSPATLKQQSLQLQTQLSSLAAPHKTDFKNIIEGFKQQGNDLKTDFKTSAKQAISDTLNQLLE